MRTPVLQSDLTEFREIDTVQLSGVTGLVAVGQSVPDDVDNIYRRDVLVGSPDGPLAPVDAGAPGATYLPRWSPAADVLAVVTRQAGSWAIRVSGTRQAGQWTDVVAGLPDAPQELAFSPDGTSLLYVVREPTDRDWFTTPEDRRPPLRLTALRYREDGVGWTVNTRRQAYLVALDGGEPVRLSRGEFDDAQFSWHPDGSAVYFVSQRQADRDRSPINEVYRLPIGAGGAAGEPERLTTTAAEHSSPMPSPDGRLLCFGSVDVLGYPSTQHLSLLDLRTGQQRSLTADLDRDCHANAVVWLDGERLATLVDRSGRIDLVEFDTTAATHRELVSGPFRVTAFDSRGGTTAIGRSGPAEPPRLLAGRNGADLAEVHAPNAALAAERSLAEPQHLPVEVAPGVTVDSWLVRPVGNRAGVGLPVILWLQGGGTQFGYQWSHEVQMLCSAGYAVLYLNARGSAGYGTDWMRAVNGRNAARPGSGWGVVDVADVSAVVRHVLEANDDLDPRRVGVMGGSYGGLMVTHLLAQTDLFRAGWAERGPYNLYSDAGTKDEAPWFFEAYLGATHLDDPESYWAASPLRLVSGITAPLIIVHSENDYRCTIGQAEELFMALKLLGREVEFVRFPGEGHGLTRTGSPVHRLQRSEILLGWFGRWLEPAAEH